LRNRVYATLRPDTRELLGRGEQSLEFIDLQDVAGDRHAEVASATDASGDRGLVTHVESAGDRQEPGFCAVASARAGLGRYNQDGRTVSVGTAAIAAPRLLVAPVTRTGIPF
jgi:hypothetical protein